MMEICARAPSHRVVFVILLQVQHNLDPLPSILQRAFKFLPCHYRQFTIPIRLSHDADIVSPHLPAAERTVFFVSDGTGITAETFGHAVLTQFELRFRQIRLPFIDTLDKAL